MPHIGYVAPTSIEDPELLAILERARELGHFVALTLGQQRFLKTVGIKHGEYMADTTAGLASAEAARAG